MRGATDIWRFNLFRLALPVMLLAMMASARAMTIEVHGSQVFAAGPVIAEDFVRFRDIFNRGGIDTVVFVNSPGGDLYTAMTVARLIAARGYRTVTAGSCMSACSILFLGGRERQFSDAFRPNLTMIGIHGAHRRISKRIDPELQPQMFAFYKARMGAAFDASLINKALYDMDDTGAYLRIPDSIRNKRARVFHCKSGFMSRRDCTEFEGKDALNLGVITSSELVRLELPETFRVKARLFGRDLIESVLSSADYVVEFVDQVCRNERCKQSVTDWAVRPENRALALRRGDSGLAATSNRDSPMIAFVGALYACNFQRDQPPALCEVRVVNNTDVRFLYEESEAGHREALELLKPPAGKYFASEELGGAPLWADQLRTTRLQDMTPQAIDGVRTLATQELASLLKDALPPRVIDVWAGEFNAIPGSDTLLYGGNAFDDPKREAVYNQRFVDMLNLLAPDRKQTLVFYAKGRDNWMAVNAAVRARRAGYADVRWYRGGFDSWTAAKLPVAPIAIRAVIN